MKHNGQEAKTMAAPKIITRAEWNAHALEMADRRHVTGTARSIGACEYGHVYRVPSRSSAGSYDVLTREDGRVECPCTAGSYGRPCVHAGAALHAEERRQQAISSANDE